jgi:hypothetical protein
MTVLIERPIVVLAAPRSGSSSLLAALAAHPSLWSLYSESRSIFEQTLHPSGNGRRSTLDVGDLTPVVKERLEKEFFRHAGNLERIPLGTLIPLRGRGRQSSGRLIRQVSRPFKHPPIRLVEKTIANAFRVPFMRALFPDACFLYLTRDPRANIAAMYRGWLNPHRYSVYPFADAFRIGGYPDTHWNYFLPPGWEKLSGRPLHHVCAYQWRVLHEYCLRDLESVDQTRHMRIKFEDLVAHPAEVLATVANWAGIPPGPMLRFSEGLPRINVTRDSVARDIPAAELDEALEMVADVASRLGYPTPVEGEP